jgi:hypothetical protein
LVAALLFGVATSARPASEDRPRCPACGIVGQGAWVSLLGSEPLVAQLPLTAAQATGIEALRTELARAPAGCELGDDDCYRQHVRYWKETIPQLAARAERTLGPRTTHRLRAAYWARSGPLRVPCDPELATYLELTRDELDTLAALLEQFQQEADGLSKGVPENDEAAANEFARRLRAKRSDFERRCLAAMARGPRERFEKLAEEGAFAGVAAGD